MLGGQPESYKAREEQIEYDFIKKRGEGERANKTERKKFSYRQTSLTLAPTKLW